MHSALFKEMIAKVEAEAGFKYLGYVSDRAPRQLSTSKTAVRKPEDLKGLKIRVPETVTIMQTLRAWGAAPTPVAASELYLAMKQGLVDGQDNGFDAIAQAKYYEVQKYVTKIDYVQSGLMVLIAADRWSRLTPAQRTALEEAAVETEAWASKTTNDGAAQSIEFLKKQGMEIVEPDLAPFKKLAAEALAKFDGDLWSKGLAEKIQAVR
jgi:TRAP-type C4-dicarboxylate transport system substrate-binding protein